MIEVRDILITEIIKHITDNIFLHMEISALFFLNGSSG